MCRRLLYLNKYCSWHHDHFFLRPKVPVWVGSCFADQDYLYMCPQTERIFLNLSANGHDEALLKINLSGRKYE
jgi:hypothetical protein